MHARAISRLSSAAALSAGVLCAGCESFQPHRTVQYAWEDYWEYREMPDLPTLEEVGEAVLVTVLVAGQVALALCCGSDVYFYNGAYYDSAWYRQHRY